MEQQSYIIVVLWTCGSIAMHNVGPRNKMVASINVLVFEWQFHYQPGKQMLASRST